MTATLPTVVHLHGVRHDTISAEGVKATANEIADLLCLASAPTVDTWDNTVTLSYPQARRLLALAAKAV